MDSIVCNNSKFHSKRIIFDLDDTISFAYNRGFDTAKPNTKLIERINYLYSAGFIITILTARGQLSCDGDYIKADKKYRKSIEHWLSQNGVNYHELSFNKPLGTYYVDDKAITPEDFIELDFNVLKGGSGADIYQLGDSVYKTGTKVVDEVIWYKYCENNFTEFKTPKIMSHVGDTIKLEFIKGTHSPIPLVDLFSLLDSFAEHKPYYNNRFSSYIERVSKHSSKHGLKTNIPDGLESFMDKKGSFNHGDLTIQNTIRSLSGDLYLIDSIMAVDLYSSYLVDLSKYLFSLYLNGENEMFDKVFQSSVEYYSINRDYLKALIIMHFIRVYTYIGEPKRKYYKWIKQQLETY